MPPDPELAAETRAWFKKAAHDLLAAEALRKSQPPLLDGAVFHCQQAAEKAMKGFLTWHGSAFRKTHSLEEIGAQCIMLDGSLAGLVSRAAPLTEFAWKYRYPGELEQPETKEAEEALCTAREVYDTLLAKLPGEIRP